ncbi:MAG: DUF4835 family protein [Saprospiraceae bacterium]
MKNIILTTLFALITFTTFAQELNVTVRVNAQKAQSDPQVFKSMENSIQEFMNNQKWTEDEFEQSERIEVNMQVTILEELSTTSFAAELQIQAIRPVFNSDYQTPLITHLDKGIRFNFEAYQPIDFQENAYTDNLSHTLAFYAYTILGLDYDSFSPYGGEKYFQKAQNLINVFPANQSASFPGWTAQSGGKQSRYWLMESLLNPSVRPFREAMYTYHRQALDLMYDDVETGKAVMMQVLETVGQVNNKYLNAMIMKVFANTKGSEIIDIFKIAPRQQKTRIYAIMSKVDPANSSKYRGIGI